MSFRELTPAEKAKLVPYPPPAPGIIPLASVTSSAGLLTAILGSEANRGHPPDWCIAVFVGSLVFAAVIIVVPSLRRFFVERWIVRNGRAVRARVVRYKRVGFYGGPGMGVVRAWLRVPREGGAEVEATADRVVIARFKDPRYFEQHVGSELAVYWHPSHPRRAVPDPDGSSFLSR